MSTGIGWRMTQSLQRRQNTPSPLLRPMTRSESTRGPSSPSSAGRSVSAARTLTNTTSAPPSPIERIDMYGMIMRPSRPTTTVRPLKKMERPAVATVVSTASATATAGRELLAEPADHEERVVDADGEAEQRRHVHREHGDVEDLGEQPEDAQGDGDGHAAADDGEGGGHQRPEDEHEHEDRHGDRVALRLAQVLRGALLELRVDGRVAGQVGRELRRLERPAQRRDLRLHLLAGAVELEHGEGRRAVARDEARVAGGLRGADAGEALEAGVLDAGESLAHLRLEGRAARRELVAA